MMYILAFILAFAGSAVFKLKYDPSHGKYQKAWNENPGTVLTDLVYGEGETNKFDLYLPADSTKKNYGLVVYLHPGGFTSGDKSGDADMCRWLASMGYVSASINYTLLWRWSRLLWLRRFFLRRSFCLISTFTMISH